jgi:hypothetical protein
MDDSGGPLTWGSAYPDSCVQARRAAIVQATDEEVADAPEGADGVGPDVVLADS